jgi:hypothetical protein
MNVVRHGCRCFQKARQFTDANTRIATAAAVNRREADAYQLATLWRMRRDHSMRIDPMREIGNLVTALEANPHFVGTRVQIVCLSSSVAFK